MASKTFLYAASGYCAINAAIFTFKPEMPVVDSFGEGEANNRPAKLMTSVTGCMFAVSGVTAYVLACGVDAATAVHCGLSLIPLRMLYDMFIEKVSPPPPAIAMTASIVGIGIARSVLK